MTEHSPEFLAQYPKHGYGTHYQRVEPDYFRCADSVRGSGRWPTFHQCTRKNGHGPHGAWCKQHDPDAVKARREAQERKWQQEWAAKRLDADLRTEAMTIIHQIAAGHNDPASLCRDWCARWDKR